MAVVLIMDCFVAHGKIVPYRMTMCTIQDHSPEFHLRYEVIERCHSF
jgi:hypothetical protein